MRIYLPAFVYGSMDGLVTTFAIVTSAVGAGLPVGIILIVGFANVFADGFSMGSSSYLASATDTHGRRPMREAGVTFVAFITLGLVPLAPFVVAFLLPSLSFSAPWWSVAITLVAFATVGYVSARIAQHNAFLGAFRNVLVGSFAAGIAFGVGYGLSQLFGV